MERHDGEQFAGFGEDKGQVVDVGKGGVAKGGSERCCQCDEEERCEGVFGRKNVERSSLVKKVEAAACKGEKGLDCVKDNGEAKEFSLRLH